MIKKTILVLSIVAVFTAVAVAYPPPNYSKYDYVFNTTSGDYNNTDNWDHTITSGNPATETGYLPGEIYGSADAAILDNGGTMTITSTPAYFPGGIKVGYTTTGNIINHTAGNMDGSNLYWFMLGMDSGGEGTYNLSGTGYMKSGLFAGYAAGGTGYANLTGGTLQSSTMCSGYSGTGYITLDGSTVTATTIRVGWYSAGVGTINLNSGSLAEIGSGLTVVVGDSGTGTVNHNNSFAYTAEELIIGEDATGDGTYNMNGGTLTLSEISGSYDYGIATIGKSGTGVFEQSAGTVTISGSGYDSSHIRDSLIIGDLDGGDGTYNLDGGILALSGDYSKAYIGKGDGSVGELNIDGGTVQAYASTAGELILGSESGSDGTINLQSGELRFYGTTFIIGDAGTGVVTQTGGTVGAQNTGNNYNVYIGGSAGGVGTYNFNGGTIADKMSLIVGDAGTGYFNQNEDATLSSVRIGWTSGGAGTYTMASGTTLNTSSITAGVHGTGTFDQGDATVILTGSLQIGTYAGGVGTYNLNGGSLTMDEGLTVGSKASATTDAVFNQFGGAVEVGGDLRVGNLEEGLGTEYGMGTYNLETGDGTLDVAGNIYVGAEDGDADGAAIMKLRSGYVTDMGNFTVGASSYVYEGDANCSSHATLEIWGDFINSSTNNVNFDMNHTTVIMAEGGIGYVEPEEEWYFTKISMDNVVDWGIDGDDMGYAEGLVNNFALGNLVFRGSTTDSWWFQLQSDIYCYGLRIEDGALVDLNGYNIYYVELGGTYNGACSATSGLDGIYGDMSGGTGDIYQIGLVPEPSTIVLIGTGVLGLAAVLRKKFC
jgi:hypothetical protein